MQVVWSRKSCLWQKWPSSISTWLSDNGQEWFQAIMALVACVLVVQMVIWMKKHGRTLKSTLESGAEGNVQRNNWWGLLALVMIAVAFTPEKVVSFFKVLAIFYISTFIFAGAAFAFMYFNQTGSFVRNGIVYVFWQSRWTVLLLSIIMVFNLHSKVKGVNNKPYITTIKGI